MSSNHKSYIIKTISHFKALIENVKIQQLELQIFKTYECKPCALSKT